MIAVKTTLELTRQEPAAFQFRVCHKKQDLELWSEWTTCPEMLYNQFKDRPDNQEFVYQVRRLFPE